MSLNDRPPQFEIAPKQMIHIQKMHANSKKTSVNEYISQPNELSADDDKQRELTKDPSKNTLINSKRKTSSKMTNKIYTDSRDKNITSNSENSYRIETEFCGKSEFICPEPRAKAGHRESDESRVIPQSHVSIEDSHIINNEIENMELEESSQMTEENFRRTPRKSPSENQSAEHSYVFKNNHIHKNLISVVKDGRHSR